MPPDPALSVLLVSDHYRTIRRVIEHLRAQTASDRIEVIIVAPSETTFGLAPDAATGLGAIRIVEVGSISPLPRAREAGVRAARAPLLFLGETHSYPQPDFAATVLAARDEHWDVLVPGFNNANPDTARSWACYLADYGYWHDTLPAGPLTTGPTWNVVYRRDALLELGEQLGSALSSGDELASAFRAAGRRWRFEPRAKLTHANVATPGHWVRERYLAGLLIAANRTRRWPLGRRMAYLLATPLIGFVVWSRIVGPARSIPRGTVPRFSSLALAAGILVRTAGEAVGYARGAAPDDEARMEEYELHKLKYTVPAA